MRRVLSIWISAVGLLVAVLAGGFYAFVYSNPAEAPLPAAADELGPLPVVYFSPRTNMPEFWQNQIEPWLEQSFTLIKPQTLAVDKMLSAPAGLKPMIALLDIRQLNDEQIRLLVETYLAWHLKRSGDTPVCVLQNAQNTSSNIALPSDWLQGYALAVDRPRSTQDVGQLLAWVPTPDFLFFESGGTKTHGLAKLFRLAAEQRLPVFVESISASLVPYHLDTRDDSIPVNVHALPDLQNKDWVVSDGVPEILTVPWEERRDLLLSQVPQNSTLRVTRQGAEVFRKQIADIRQNKHSAERGIYATSLMAGNKVWRDKMLTQMKAVSLNTFVINIKDIEGIVGTKFHDPLSEAIDGEKAYIKDFKAMVDDLHSADIRVSARIAVFQDHQLAHHHPEWSLPAPGGGFSGWLNPAQREVVEYNIRLAEIAAKAGADEIQFDYIRYPEDHVAIWPGEPSAEGKVQNISNFLREAYQVLSPLGVSIAADVFGIMLWQTQADLAVTGQDLRLMARYLDVISPMIYPSHFAYGFQGYANPAMEPQIIMKQCASLMQAELGDLPVRVVPWIQGFGYHVKDYGPWYVAEQIKTLEQAGFPYYLVWNAANVYTTVYPALEMLAKHKHTALQSTVVAR